MRTIGVVTSSRADYGISYPILREIQKTSGLKLDLYVTGSHLLPEFGLTVEQIERDGFPVSACVPMMDDSRDAKGIASSIGRGVMGFANVYGEKRPDILMLLGDRYEMLAAACAALPFEMPIAHIHGGESTVGAIDEAIRHSLTKMSHIHFVSTEAYRNRVIQMGEGPERVHVSGAPSLDNLANIKLLSLDELETQRGLRLKKPFLLVTYHPVTLESKRMNEYLDDLFAALEAVEQNILFTYPNADTESNRIIERIDSFVKKHPRAQAVVNLGTQGYFSVMSHAAAMVGNSSSGIIEAASFKLPVVNIGKRQIGRISGANVIHTETSTKAILDGIRQAMELNLESLVNPYGDGCAASRIVNKLRELEIGPDLLIKRFHQVD